MTARGSVETQVYLFTAAGACMGAAAGLTPPPSVQTALLAFGVLVFGLPHGALDPLIARRAGLITGWRSAVGFHLAYGGAALAMLLVWLIAPGPALAGFLAYSAHHFAGDWLRTGTARRLALGAAVLGLPSIMHGDQVADIYTVLSGPAGAQIAQLQSALAPLWLSVLTGMALFEAWSRRRAHALEIAGLMATGLILPPLVFFALYFCCLHSPRHFLQVWRGGVDKPLVVRTAALYSVLAALIAVIIAAAAAPAVRLEASVLQTVFVGLAALTVPHLLMSSLTRPALP